MNNLLDVIALLSPIQKLTASGDLPENQCKHSVQNDRKA